jgi:hypothetical protein
MSLPKTAGWFHRANSPQRSRVPLGFAGEFWEPDPSHYQGAAELKARFRPLGYKKTKRQLAHELAQFLLNDLLVAAGGVEISTIRFRNAVDRARAFIVKHNVQARPGVRTGVADISTMEAWYAFADLLVWLRAVEERVERRGKGAKDNQGLLPALKPKRLRKRVELAFASYRANPAIHSARQLSNFTLHGSLVQHPPSGAALRPDGTLHLPVPDPPTADVAHWLLLTWQLDRDGIGLAEAMWEAVQTLIDRILDAFERAKPKRVAA